ncbi:MAG: methyltransferase domain-containing protein, partial [Cyanobacteria bacterium P01_H01_bin.119]
MTSASESANLYQQIQQFYDATSGLWEQVWGEHMHHGYYGPTGTHQKERRQAQIDLIEAVLTWGDVTQAKQILDVGCGIGGSTLYLAEKYTAQAVGITLSPVQAKRAAARSQSAGFSLDPNQPEKSPQATFQVANALDTPFDDNQFDFIWSMESGEHMPDKEQFLRECYQLLQPGGIFLMATWCHRPTNTLAGGLTADEQAHLKLIYDLYHLPYVISLPEYSAIARNIGFQSIRTADWSTAVAPFWNLVIDSAINPGVIAG